MGNKEIIVIIGYGWVGQANALSLVRLGYDVFCYDIIPSKLHYSDTYDALYEQVRPLQTPLEKDGGNTWYLVCIGDRVDEGGGQDISLIERALQNFSDCQGHVILRSTVIPSALPRLRFEYYVPEFLHELSAVEECLNPYYFVIGEREKKELPSFLRAWQERSEKVFMGTPEDAAYIKYLSNIWNAVRIAFVNEFGDSIGSPVNDHERQRIERVMDFVLERKSYLKYGQSFGGHCLPKDLRAYMNMAGIAGKSIPLMRGAYESNTAHAKLEQQYLLPKWFSAWEYGKTRVLKNKLLNWWQRLNAYPLVQTLRHRAKPVLVWYDRLVPDPSLPDLKARWNEWANQQPYYYANPDTDAREQVDEFAIRESGQKDWLRFIAGDERLRVVAPFADKAALEIGSGVGRMTEFLAKEFRDVTALDLSESMVEIAKKRLSTVGNVIFAVAGGNTIPFPDNQFDFIFSYQVFKHVPSSVLIGDYLREIKRTLKPGGMAKIHLRTGPAIHKWRWFYGVSVTPEEAKTLAEQAGLTVLDTKVEDVKNLWVWMRKN